LGENSKNNNAMIIHWSSIDIQKKYNRNSIEINRDPMAIWSRSNRYPQEMQYRSKGRSEKIQRRSNGDTIEIEMGS